MAVVNRTPISFHARGRTFALAAAVSAVRDAVAEGDPFEAVLLDRSMPGRDGIDLARSLHADPANARTRLIMLTSSGAPPPEELRAAGVAVCLSKPTLASELRQVLLAELADRGPRPGSERPPTPEAPGPRRVLVVEDNPVNQLGASGLLESLGYRVEVADDGESALEALADGQYALVLMDVQMPRMDGYAATRAIRARERETGGRIPVIAMTAAAVEGERERCLDAGMDDFLTKPVDPRALAGTIEHWLRTEQSDAARRTLPLVIDAIDATDGPEGLDGLELERLDELRDLDPGNTTYLDRAIGNFLRNTPETLAVLRQAVADGDAPTLKQISHKLAGGALNLGVMAAGRTAQQIELVADTGSTLGAADLLDRLEQELTEGRAALAAYQATYSSDVATS